MITYGDATYGYTPNGSLKFKALNSDTTWYTYDLLGNLISVTLPNGDFIEYIIDGQNRRVGKVVNGQFRKGWLYQDQLNPVAELDSDGNVIARFVYGTKGHVPDFMVKGDSTYRFITDHLGSVRLVVNIETNHIAQRLDYDEFGNMLVNTNPDFQPFGYAGGLFDEQTGLVRFGARDYDAGVGRWLAKDPVGFGGSYLNFYSYANNNPINIIDVTGLDCYYVAIGKPFWRPTDISKKVLSDFSSWKLIVHKKTMIDVDMLADPASVIPGGSTVPGVVIVKEYKRWSRYQTEETYYKIELRQRQVFICEDECGKVSESWAPAKVLKTDWMLTKEEKIYEYKKRTRYYPSFSISKYLLNDLFE